MVNAINLTMTSKQDIATWKANRRKLAYSTVGTPDYVSAVDGIKVEIEADLRFRRKSSCSRATGRNAIGGLSVLSCSSVSLVRASLVRWGLWLISGYPPFCSENAHDVYRKIIDWRNHLYFPDDVHLSREAEDLVRR